MRLAALGSALTALALLLFPGALAQAENIAITAKPLGALAPLDPERTQFGKLIFLAGAELVPDDRRSFGGISSIVIGPDGKTLTGVTDVGGWITAEISEMPDGTPTLSGVEMGNILDSDGKPLKSKRWSDAEGIAAVPGRPGRFQVSFERHNRIWEYDLGGSGMAARPKDIPVPEALRDLPENKGPEALAVLPAGSPLGAATIAIAEEPHDGFLTGYIIGGKTPGTFRIRAHDDFDATDAALDPDGNLILLERYFSILTGPKMALHRIRLADIADDATVYPELLMTSDIALEIDNMEALGIHEDEQGRTILTIMSDNNFTRLQRTLLLRFELVD
ncbi:MAG: esterase-like activity of phytase family protein [Rhodobiaceae bacterium]|nr:esterase-like activity of phytase family protein [Rhodobiaceae bacterium]MCC0049904.1 esterase-like activity of phytase family protein [Rhodobiaceae bacterium]